MHADKRNNLDTWYNHPLGTRLLAAELTALGNILPKMFGYYIVAISNLNKPSAILATSTIHNRITVNSSYPLSPNFYNVQSDISTLPFLPESIDIIVLFHVLEFTKNPYTILQECYNSLMKGGNLVIISFNPWSLWGIHKLFYKHIQQNNNTLTPWEGDWIKSKKLKHLLRNCEFDVGDHQTFYFRPPCQQPEKMLSFEWLGPIVWPYAGASYIQVAHKTALETVSIKQHHIPIISPHIPKELTKPISRTTSCTQTPQL